MYGNLFFFEGGGVGRWLFRTGVCFCDNRNLFDIPLTRCGSVLVGIIVESPTGYLRPLTTVVHELTGILIFVGRWR
jgi:hypothetical protein